MQPPGVTAHAVRPVLQVGVAPTHSGLVTVPQAAQLPAEQGLGVAPDAHVPPVQTGCVAAPQGTHAVPPALGTLEPVQAVTRHDPDEHVKVEPLAMSVALHA